MAHVMKHTKAACGHMVKHYERAKDENGEYIKFANQEINPALSGSNINYAPARDTSQGEFIRQRCAAVRMQNRKDVNVMCSWVVTLPREILPEEKERFFAESYRFLSGRYGKENVVSAYVHNDETTPHMHFAFVPIVEDKKRGGWKVSAKEAVNRKDLQTFHQDLDAHMQQVFGRDVGILNAATKEGNKSIDALKRGTAVDAAADAERQLANAQRKLAKTQSDIAALEAQKNALQSKYDDMKSKFKGYALTMREVAEIQPQRTFSGGLKGVTVEDVENLKATAVKHLEATDKLVQLSQDYQRLSKLVPTAQDRLQQAQTQKRLQALEALEATVQRLPENVRKEHFPAFFPEKTEKSPSKAKIQNRKKGQER